MVQVGGRPLRLAEVGDEQTEVFVRVGRVRMGERLVRVAGVQGKVGCGRVTTWLRLRMVALTARRLVALRIKRLCCGGSSRVFSRAFSA